MIRPLRSGGLNHGLTVGLNTAEQGRSGRYVLESGPIMLELSFVGCDPKPKSKATPCRACSGLGSLDIVAPLRGITHRIASVARSHCYHRGGTAVLKPRMLRISKLLAIISLAVVSAPTIAAQLAVGIEYSY